MPTRCSTTCLNNVNILAIENFLDSSYLFEMVQIQRYTIDFTPADSIGVLFSCLAAKVYTAMRVFVKKIDEYAVAYCEISQLQAILTYSVGALPPWPPWLSINFAIIQWTQQPLLLLQQNGDGFWTEKVPFQHNRIVQQVSICIQWKLSWLSLRLLDWAGDCGQQKQLHFPSTKLETSVKLPDYSSRKVELHYFHEYASLATIVGTKPFSVTELSGTVGAKVMVRLYPMSSTEVLFRYNVRCKSNEVNWSVEHMSRTNVEVIQSDYCFLYLAYLSCDSEYRVAKVSMICFTSKKNWQIKLLSETGYLCIIPFHCDWALWLQDGYKSPNAIQVTLILVLPDIGCLRPLPWPSFNQEAVIEYRSVGTPFGISEWYFQHWLEFHNGYFLMEWESFWAMDEMVLMLLSFLEGTVISSSHIRLGLVLDDLVIDIQTKLSANSELYRLLAGIGGSMHQKHHDNHSYLLRCYAFMSKLLLSRINSSQCGTFLEVLQDMQKLIALLVIVVGVLVSYTGTAILNSSDHGELQNAAASFQSSEKLRIFSREFQELLSLLQPSDKYFQEQSQLWDPGGLQQRLEGKPHFKRWGMSWTGPPVGQWAGVTSGPVGWLRGKQLAADKREEEREKKGSNRTRLTSSSTSVPLSRNLSHEP